MAARSTNVTFIDNTPFSLILAGSAVTDGEWVSRPPMSIASGGEGMWGTQNSSPLTGTAGNVTYQSANPQITVFIEWSNPYIGDNNYNTSVTPAGFSLKQEGGSGDNANVTFILVQD